MQSNQIQSVIEEEEDDYFEPKDDVLAEYEQHSKQDEMTDLDWQYAKGIELEMELESEQI